MVPSPSTPPWRPATWLRSAAEVDHVTAAALPMPGLTAWQALFDHAHLQTGQTVVIHGAGGSVGSVAVQLARETGAHIIGTGRASDRRTTDSQVAIQVIASGSAPVSGSVGMSSGCRSALGRT
jgi:NADPH:quinone reductase-like Zn-dependent oxidoreductase